MKKVSGLLILFFAIAASDPGISLCGQENQGMVKYTSDFRFTDGLYLSFFAARNNSPVPKNRIVTAIDYNSNDFFIKLMGNKTISYYDTSGEKKEVKKNEVWGYADKGIIYMNFMGSFNPFTFTGKICHVISEIKLNDTVYYDPAYRGNLYPYDTYSYSNRYYDPYYSRYYSNYSRRRGSQKIEPPPGMEINQYLLDFETG